MVLSAFSGVNRQCDLTPGDDGLGAELAMIGGGEIFPMEMKEVGDLAVNRDETLTLACRFEAHHPSLSPPQRKMRIFGAVVQPLVRSMLNAGDQLSFRRSIRAQLVSHHHPGRDALTFEQLAHEPQRCLLVPSAL